MCCVCSCLRLMCSGAGVLALPNSFAEGGVVVSAACRLPACLHVCIFLLIAHFCLPPARCSLAPSSVVQASSILLLILALVTNYCMRCLLECVDKIVGSKGRTNYNIVLRSSRIVLFLHKNFG